MFPLHQYAVSNIQEHGSRVFSAGFGLRPDLNPDRLAVVLAAKLDDDTSRLHAANLQRELLVGSALGVGPVGDERQPHDSGHFFGLDPQDSPGGAVGADEP